MKPSVSSPSNGSISGALDKPAHETVKTVIHSNGNKWAGEEPDTIEKLIEVLKNNELDLTKYGAFGFIAFRESNGYSSKMYEEHSVQISGNFKNLTHGFDIEGVYQNLESLIRAIESNIERQMDRLEAK